MKENHEWAYLMRVIDAVKAGLFADASATMFAPTSIKIVEPPAGVIMQPPFEKTADGDE